MSTRAIIAYAPEGGTGQWTGVYNHSDGYPTGLGRKLHRACGEEFAGDADALGHYATVEHASWSHFAAPSEFPERGGCHCHGEGADVGLDEPRYGPDDLADAWWIEWVYVIEPDWLIVLGPSEQGWRPVGHVAWTDEPTEADWTRIECGEHFERCTHYAWVHFDVPEESKRLGTAKWLGREPLDPIQDAIGWRLIDGTVAHRGGHGFAGTYYGRARGWYEDVTLPDGRSVDLRVCLGERTRRLRSHLTPIYPPTRERT